MPDRFILQPFRFGAQEQGTAGKVYNGVAVTGDADRHLRDKILAVLFTAPGERVNNPRFGVGLNRAVFDKLNELTAAALEFRISQGLRRDLGDEVVVEAVDLDMDPPHGELLLTVAYRRRSDRGRRRLEIEL
jgi:phage baseplate assembly protein W